MKKTLFILGMVVGLVGFMTVGAQALPMINGQINFTGTSQFDASTITFLTANVNGLTDGSYAGVAQGTAVTFNGFTYSPFTAPSPNLWSFTVGSGPSAVTYSFDASALTVDTLTTVGGLNTLTLGGSGMAYITGFAPTPGVWTVTANQSGSSGSFSSTAAVPEPATLLLLGIALLGLGIIGLRWKGKA